MGDWHDGFTRTIAVAGVPAEYDGSIATAEAEGVASGDVHAAAAGCVGNVVEVAVGILKLVINGRRQDVIANSEATGGNLGGATSALQVAKGRFSGTDWQLVGVVTENFFDNDGFGFIAKRSGGAVGVEIIHLVGPNTGMSERELHGAGALFASGIGVAHVMGIAGAGPADHFSVNVGTAAASVIQFFQRDDATAFADDEPIAFGVEWARGFFRFVVSGSEGVDCAKGDDDDRMDRCIGAAGQHHIGITPADKVGGMGDGGGGTITTG